MRSRKGVRRFLWGVAAWGAAVLLCALLATTAEAEEPVWGPDGKLQPIAGFPSREITIWNVHGPGHSDEIEARLLARELQKYSPVPVHVQSAGTGPRLHFELFDRWETMRGGKDGYHIAVASLSGATIRSVTVAAGPIEKLARGTFLVSSVGPAVLIARNDVPFRTVPEMIAYMRANPGEVRVGTHHVGSGAHTGFRGFAAEAGIEPNHHFIEVPHGGDAQVHFTLMGGGIEVAITTANIARQVVDSGAGFALMIWSVEPSEAWPGVPTSRELGYGLGHGALRSLGLVVHPDAPANARAWLTEALGKVISGEAYREHAELQGYTPLGMSGQEAHDYIIDMYEEVKPLIYSLGLAAEQQR